MIQHLILIDNRIQNYSDFKDNINTDSYAVVYDYYLDDIDSIHQKLTGITSIDRIAFVFHGLSLESQVYEIGFIQQQPFFTANDISDMTSSTHYSHNLQFLLDLATQYSVSHIDFLGCNLLTFTAWRSFFQLFTDRGITVGASNDATGNLKYGGDWIMESTMEDVKQIYFTDGLLNYASLLLYYNTINAIQYYHDFYTYSATNPTVLNRKIYDNSSTLIYTEDVSFGGMSISNVLALLDDNGTTPYTIGIVDPSMNKVRFDLAYADVFRKAFSDTEKTKLITYVNKVYKEPHTIVDVSYTVTYNNTIFIVKNSANTIVNEPLSLTAGNLYIFDQSDTSNTGTNLILKNSTMLLEITTGVTKNGIPGTFNAYTMVSPATNLLVYTNYIGSLILDFDANQNVTSDTNGVSQWTDTYNSKIVSQTTTLNKPSLVTNSIVTKSTLFFGSSNSRILNHESSQVTTTTKTLTIFLVIRTPSNLSNKGANYILTTNGTTWTSQSFQIQFLNADFIYGVNLNGTSSYFQSSALTANENYIIAITINTINGPFFTCKMNGSTMTNTNSVNTQSNTDYSINTVFDIGNNAVGGGVSYKGYLGEFMYYNTVLTPSQIERVEGHLAWKWSLLNNLPLSHPYKSITSSPGYI